MKRNLIILMFAGLGAAACSEEPARPSVYVPESWKDFRRGEMHVRHLEEDVKCAECHAVEGSGFGSPGTIICDDCHETVVDTMHISDRAPTGECMECHTFREKTDVGKAECSRCHDGKVALAPKTHTEDCLACHQPHKTPAAQIESCEKCHEGMTTLTHLTVKDPVERCANCHEVHGGVRACATCHEPQAPAIAKGHDECATCHVAHDVPRTCESCHKKTTTLGHATCWTCHDPHQIRTDPRETCASCHSDVLVDHQPEDTCGNCHGGHEAPTSDCTSCHQNAPTDRSLHNGKLACEQCHQPHQFAIDAAPERCGACHEVQQKQVIEEHADCGKCHGNAHAPAKGDYACKDCHTVGKHDTCRDCHDPHDGKNKVGIDGCRTCHEEVQSHAPELACNKCHDAHATKVDAVCGNCHEARPALHKNAGHQECKDCHQAHQKETPSNREVCGRCHENLENHEPAAKVCRGCHPFTD